MLRCSPEAFAQCPTRHICGKIEDATFTEGSECDLFNWSVASNPMTNADRIRAMSDEELADALYKQTDLESQTKFCQNLPECSELLETEDGIPEHKCKACLLEWLRHPAKEET